MTNILVINAGSSSLKYQLIDIDTESVIAKGICERIGIPGSLLSYRPTGGEKYEKQQDMRDHQDAIRMVLEILSDPKIGVISDMSSIAAVGHRVLHGGEKYSEPVLIDDKVLEAIEECVPLGPLHNPANLMGIRGCMAVMPNVPMVAVFDTAWGQSMPKKAFMYALPYEAYEQFKVRRYGFHGTSHRYVAGRAIQKLDMPKEQTRVITCHLGNGSSLSAVKGGKCIDTSMGLTPLEGVPMGTRCGSIDPAIMPFLMDKLGLSAAEMDTYMNKKAACSAFPAYPATSVIWMPPRGRGTSAQSWRCRCLPIRSRSTSAHMLRRSTALTPLCLRPASVRTTAVCASLS